MHSYTVFSRLGAGLLFFLTVAISAFAQTAPSIYNQPAPQTADAGQAVSFSIYVSASPSPTYQWQRLPVGGSTWVNLSDTGAYTNTTTYQLNISLATLVMSGDQFRCVVTNAAGSVTSAAALLTVGPAVAPQIFGLSAAVTVNSGSSISLNPSFSGTTPMTYQWKKEGVAISGATFSYFSKSGVTTADSGQYTITVTNYAGTTTSAATAVTVNPAVAPVILNLPATAFVDSGASFSFNPTVSGTQPITYQWKKDGVAISGATSSSYSKSSNVTTADDGAYTLTATNSGGAVTSSAVTLTVSPAVAPVIYNLPATATANTGASFGFNPSVSGTQPITYQWKKDGVAISGATSSSYSKSSNVTTADNGAYTLTATNSVGTATSTAITLTVNPAVAPAIYNLPASATANTGTSFSFSPTVSGTQPITFQWNKDGVAISGATSSSYSKSSNVTTADNGAYTLTATNSVATVTSAAITLTVNPAVAPVISNLPASTTVNVGGYFSFSPTVSGTQPITYQWKKDGVAISGATSSSYTRYYDVTTADSGAYTLTATNSAGTVTSAVVTLTVPNAAPVIYNLSATATAESGGSFTFYPTVSGTQPITYQWKKDGVAISGATSSNYSKYSNVTTADSGAYTLTATNSAGTVTSTAITLTVNPAVAPAIYNLPATATAEPGGSVSFSPTVSGTQPITYQWKKDGVAISGATSSSYSKYSNVTTADNGAYTLTAVNSVGTVTSTTITLTVNPAVAPTIYNLPASAFVESGASFSFNPSVSGTQPIIYQWKKNGVAISGATSSGYSKYSNVTTADNGAYTLTATNSVGTVTSTTISLTVNPAVAPVIYNLQAFVTVDIGGYLSLNPSVSGTQPITYQWKKDGVAISGATSYYYTKYYDTTTADSGAYTLTATNSVGTVTSTAITVTVNPVAAPVIYNLPATATVDFGGSFSFSPSVSGTQPITYQWKKDGVGIYNATSISYSKSSNVTTADSGAYTLTATNSAGTVTSVAVTLTVNPTVAPVINGLPLSLVADSGGSFSFNPSVSGTQPITYQWKKDGVEIYNATSISYSKSSNVTTADSGAYTVTATNSVGTVTSAAVTLTVNPAMAPAIYNLPAAVTVNAGASFLFSPTVSGTQPITYQWKKDGVTISGATSSSYSKSSNVTPSDNGAYTLTATNSLGTVTSTAITLTVNPAVAPVILNLPASLTVNVGGYFSFSPTVSGTQPITYQWKKDGVAISGATSSNYSRYYDVTIADSGAYTLTATNSAGAVTSAAVTVIVPNVAPVIYNLPVTTIVDSGGSFNFSPTVNGTQPITYQWKKDGVAISGATSSSYSKYSNVTTADNGAYTLTATNAAGTVTSAAITLTVNPAVAPVIYNLPASITTDIGGYFSFSPTVSGSQPITYQWKKDGVAISGAISSSYSRYYDVTTADAGAYTLTATNSVGTVTSAAITLTVNPPVAPAIYNLPATATADSGGSFGFNPTVNGTQPITYQWKKDGVVIAGATSSSYSKYNTATIADGGAYTLTATNSVGTVTSTAITLTVNPAVAPAIYNLPATVTANTGASFSFNPSVSGTQPITYQWKKDGVAITGATYSSYSKYSNATSADNGAYTLTATNSVGTVTSTAVTLTVNPEAAPVIYNLPAIATADSGGSFVFSPTVSGTQPITYQWKKDGVEIYNATSISYSKSSNVTTADNGAYTLTATNSAGTVTSTAVTLTVGPAVAPAINGLPVNLAVESGTSFSFNPVVSGSQPITYQWKKDGVEIYNATSSNYTKSGNVTTADNGAYTLTATNSVGTVTSAAVTLTVNPAVAPAINGLPVNLAVEWGASFSFNPVVSGTQPITYQWKKEGVAILGATFSSYSKSSNTTPGDNGVYTLTATNSVGTVTSTAVSLTVNPAIAPTIYNLPVAISVSYANSISLSPSVSGTLPITYQWKKDSVAIANATSLSFSKSNATTADSGSYTLSATNTVGTVTSAAVTVSVNPAIAPGIYNLPAYTVIRNYGDSLSFNPTITGTPSITYQWKKDGVAIANGNNSSYYSYYLTTADSGQYTLEATNLVGTTTSSSVTVSVNAAIAPTITQQPSALSIDQGLTANFSVSATGTSPFSFQWQFAGAPIAGATYSTLVLSNVQPASAGTYTVVVTNPGGSVTSNSVSLVVNPGVGVVSSSAGSYHTLFIQSNGTLWGMGDNDYGQLGDGTTVSSLNYRQIATGVVSVSAGYSHTLFIKSDGALWAMGYNSFGQLGDGTTLSRLNPVQIATSVVSVAAGNSHTLFVKSDGTLWAMGNNSYGQLGDGTTNSHLNPVPIATSVLSVAAGNGHTLFVKSDGTLWAMGYNGYGQLGDGTSVSRLTPVPIATGVVAVSAGNSHTLFTKSDGTLWAMGNNGSGQLGDGTTVSRFNPVQIATGVASASAGSNHSLCIKSDGTLWATGYNGYAQLGDGTTTNRVDPVQIASSVASTSAGLTHSVFNKSDGTLWVMGNGSSGQLGLGTSSYYNYVPVKVVTGAITAPIAPISPLVNDAAPSTGTRLTWSPALGTSSYEIWRNTTNDSTSATRIASNVPFALYYDLTATSGTYYYWIKAANSSGTSTFSSSTTPITVGAPVITTQPVNRTVEVGVSVTFTITATGTPAPTYQWKKNGWAISGATASSYTIASVAMGDEGSYSVVATNSVGSATSNAAVLTPFIAAPNGAVINFTVE